MEPNISDQLRPIAVDADSGVSVFGPSERDLNEKIKLLTIFPEEIWVMILEFIPEDSKDLQSVSNSSPFLRSLVLESRTLFLFPQVWETFESYYRKIYKRDYNEWSKNDYINRQTQLVSTRCATCGSTRERRECSPILHLRQICKSWTHALDNFYQNNPFHYHMHHDDPNNFLDIADCELITYEFDYVGVKQAPEFLRHFSETHFCRFNGRSPFVSRGLRLNFSSVAAREDEEEQVLMVLMSYGKYVHHIASTATFGEDVARFYTNLRFWLEHTPSLKTLDLHYWLSIKPQQQRDLTERLQTAMSLGRIPPLENLEFLRARDLPPAVFNELVRNCGNLSMLEVTGNNSFTQFALPNLKQLSLRSYGESEIRSLETCQWNWPLTKLYLDSDSQAFIEWTRLFTLLERKWSQTLTDLVIKLLAPNCHRQERNIIENCKSFRLSLPLVKRFKVTIGSFSSLDFILPMRDSLESLNISVEFCAQMWQSIALAEAVRNGQTIQFLGYYKRFLKSNIWKLFPKLKELTCADTFIRTAAATNSFHGPEIIATSWKHSRQEWLVNKGKQNGI